MASSFHERRALIRVTAVPTNGQHSVPLLEFDTLDSEETLSNMVEVIHYNGGQIRAADSQAVPPEEVFADLMKKEGID